MHSKLTDICREFETLKGFLQEPTPVKEEKLNLLFQNFIECFANLQGEKLEYPKEFRDDVRLYKENYEPILKKFEDIEIRYLMLSDFYDYVRITKKYITSIKYSK